MVRGKQIRSRRWYWHVTALLALWPLWVSAQLFEAPAPVAASSAPPAVADVTVDGHLLVRVRGIASFPAERRAKEIAKRIAAAAADPRNVVEAVRMEAQGEERVSYYIGDEFLFNLFAADAETEGVSLSVLAKPTEQRVKEAITAYRHDRSAGVIVRNIAHAVGATVVGALVLFGLLRLFRWINREVDERIEKRIESLEAKSLKLIRAQQVSGMLRHALAALRIVAIAFAAYVYLNYVLSLFPVTREIGSPLLARVVDTLAGILHAFVAYIPSLVFLAIVVILTRYILRSTRALFDAIQHQNIRLEHFQPEWAWPTYRLVRIVVVAFALVIAYPYIPGSDSGAFKGISLFLGVLFSLGSTSVIANVIAGYTMTYRRAFRIGDRVQIGDTVGEVMEMRLLVTHLRSVKNEEIVVPNSVILNSNVINYSSLAAQRGLILHTTVGIGYEVPWRQVEAMLLMAAKRTSGVLEDPAPFVLQTGLGDFAVNYELNVYCHDAATMPQRYTELHRNILDVFNEYGVQIMTPSYESDPAQPKLVSKEHWYDAPARGGESTNSG